jgi:hypothetical protein
MLLDKRGWTAATLQRQTRATEETVNKWLAGTARPRRHELITMASAFGEQDWDELLGGYGARQLIRTIQGLPKAKAQGADTGTGPQGRAL